MNKPGSPTPKSPLIIRSFGWVLGTLSLLNLATDLRLVELYGDLRAWIEAYSMLVSTLGHFLFGWVEWRWIKVESDEYHVLVVAALVSGTMGRASYSTFIRREMDEAVLTALSLGTIIFLMSLTACILLPKALSLLINILILALASIGLIHTEEPNKEPSVDPSDFFRQVIIVLAAFLAVILVNYIIFKK